MRVSYNWLKDYLDFNSSVEEISDLLTNSGLEVEKAYPLFKDFDNSLVLKLLISSVSKKTTSSFWIFSESAHFSASSLSFLLIANFEIKIKRYAACQLGQQCNSAGISGISRALPPLATPRGDGCLIFSRFCGYFQNILINLSLRSLIVWLYNLSYCKHFCFYENQLFAILVLALNRNPGENPWNE